MIMKEGVELVFLLRYLVVCVFVFLIDVSDEVFEYVVEVLHKVFVHPEVF
jgi:hypothetical protein